MEKKNDIMFIGDIHGDTNTILDIYKRYDLKDMSMIQVGDFGLGFDTIYSNKESLHWLNRCLKGRNIILYIVRGNHDNPSLFKNDIFEFSNIKLIHDNDVINIGGHNILFLGGAISIDRTMRKDGKTYWHDEMYVLDENRLRDMRGIDIVVSHSAPSSMYPYNTNGFGSIVNSYLKYDDKLKDDLLKERADLQKAFNIIKENNNIKYYIYGHFHDSHIEVVDGVTEVLLDINGVYNL